MDRQLIAIIALFVPAIVIVLTVLVSLAYHHPFEFLVCAFVAAVATAMAQGMYLFGERVAHRANRGQGR